MLEADENGVVSLPVSAESTEKRSAPGIYSGYTFASYNGYKRHSEYLTVRDGTRLAIDYLIPTIDGKEADEPLPVIWEFTPYGRIMKRDGHPVQMKSLRDIALITHGYIMARAEVRGTFASFGIRPVTNSPYDTWDGCDINEWIYSQPWCSGKIGMIGGSYTGQTILSTMAGVPKHLACAFITCTDYNKYDGWVRGSIARCFGGNPDNDPDVPLDRQLEMAVPVDDDPDGVLLKEAVSNHALNGSQVAPFKQLLYRNDWSEQSDSEMWNAVSASPHKDSINKSGTAVYLAGGLYDVFRRDTFIMYNNMTLPKKMIIGPWYHCGDAGIDMAAENLRFYDYWLKGVDNHLMDEPPIYLKTQFAPEGEDWSFLNEWPLPEEKRISVFLGDGKVSFDPCRETGRYDDYTADYSIMTGVESADTAELDGKALVYTSDTLEKDLRLTGHPVADIWVSANVPDADFFVNMTDVGPDGETFMIADGRLRASLRKVDEPDYDFLGLPYHRANREDAHFLENGKPVCLKIDLMPVSYVLKAGHRIRIQICNAMRGFFFQKSDPPAQVRIYTDALHPSYISLPVIE